MQAVYLNKNQERRLLAGHLWIYSNEIDTKRSPLKQFQAGETVKIITSQGRMLGLGYINPQCLLCVRLLTREANIQIDQGFFYKRMEVALALRERLFAQPYYRAVYGESDGLPGLVIDRFNDIWVIQINTAGMELKLELIVETLKKLRPTKTIVLSNGSSQRKLEGLAQYKKVVYGPTLETCQILENDCQFEASLLSGQKTAWFYDHRANRRLVSQFAKDKTVLDVFSYLGAFALPCAQQGARRIVTIDASTPATEQLMHNAKLNGFKQIEVINEDAFTAMQNLIVEKTKFDIVVLDPPALIKKKKDFDAGVRAYQKLNELALQLLNPGGLLFSASCSMHLPEEELRSILRRSGLKQKQAIKLLHRCCQDLDHPVHPAIVETEYLKGFLVAVE